MSESPPPLRAWPMFRAMVGAGVLCGTLLAGVFHATRARIERNEAAALERAIFEVLPEARSRRSFRRAVGGGFEPAPPAPAGAAAAVDGSTVHAGYNAEDRLVGFAIAAEGMGYQDTIRVLYGYSPAAEAIVGLRVLASRETPGLGDRIANDPIFLANFDSLRVALDASGTALAQPIEATRRGRKAHPWQVDAITGATVSSAAIADLLQRSASFWIPQLRRGLDDFLERE